MPAPYRYHVISHTHWDREWYQEFEGYRQRLVFQLDQLLDLLERDPAYRCFHLDGQTSPVRDYLELRPERAAAFARFVQADRIMIGPFFVQSDEFIVGGESLVRNVLTSDRITRGFGVEPTPIGYVTDSFGHCSQLPQLLRQMGLRAAILHYGTSGADEKTEMVWEGADGSEVLLVKIHVHSSYTDFDAYTRWPQFMDKRPQYIADKQALATTRILYGMDGGDHQPPRPCVHERIQLLARETGWEVVHSTMREYLKDLFHAMGPQWTKGRIRFRGELRTTSKQGAWNALHQGTGSSRLPIKQANDAIEWLHYRAAEPLEAWTVLLGADRQQAFLREAQRQLLLTHPHDSIVGCSVDQAHRDMMYRFDQARCITRNSVRESVVELGRRIDTRGFGDLVRVATLVNTANEATGPVTVAELEIPSDEWTANAGKQLFFADAAGRRIPLEILEHEERVRSERFTMKRHDGATAYTVGWGQSHMPMERLRVIGPFTLPPLGYDSFQLCFASPGQEPALAPEVPRVRVDARRRILENAALRVTIHEDGRFDLTDRRSNRTYRRLHQLEDVGDAGDGWNFREPKQDRLILSTDRATRSPVSITVAAQGALTACATIQYRLRVPADLEPAEAQRAKAVRSRSATLVELPITIVLTLHAGSERLEIRTTILNTAKCHRVRALLPTGLTAKTWFADSPFDAVERSIRLRDTTGWQEPAREHHPIRNWVAAFDGKQGLAVLTKGLCEGCVRDRPGQPIALTLYRSFCEELQHHRTQDSQLLGELVMEYALLPLRSRDGQLPPELWRELDTYKAPRLFHVALSHAGTLPVQGQFLHVSGPIVLTAVKSAEDGMGVVVRVFNPSRRPVRGALQTGMALRGARPLTVLERPAGPAQRTDRHGVLPLRLAPKQIQTWRLDLARQERGRERAPAGAGGAR